MGMTKAFGTLALVAMGCLSGCASVPNSAPRFAAAAAAPTGYQNVYIYRIGAYPTKRTPTIAIDGKPVFDPPETAYTVVHLTPGQHWISTKWSWDAGTPPLSVPFEIANGPVYIRLSGDFDFRGLSYRVGTNIGMVPQAPTEAELSRCCRYVAAQGWAN